MGSSGREALPPAVSEACGVARTGPPSPWDKTRTHTHRVLRHRELTASGGAVLRRKTPQSSGSRAFPGSRVWTRRGAWLSGTGVGQASRAGRVRRSTALTASRAWWAATAAGTWQFLAQTMSAQTMKMKLERCHVHSLRWSAQTMKMKFMFSQDLPLETHSVRSVCIFSRARRTLRRATLCVNRHTDRRERPSARSAPF